MENTIEHFKPDFFIPGAAKSGTTTLHDLLNTHKDISMSKTKEPVYWNNKEFGKFGKFEKLRYKNLFNYDSVIKGESTTSYMYYESFIKNINENYSRPPKFIFILRNPIDRYISHVNWMKGLGLEKNNLKNIIDVGIIKDFKEYNYYPKNYFQFGLYYKWISRFIETFGEQNIKIITFERLIDDRVNVINSCFKFLGVNKIEHIKNIQSNKSEEIIFPSLYHLLRKTLIGKIKFASTIGLIFPKKVKFFIKNFIKSSIDNWRTKDFKKNELDITYRNKLRDAYIEDVKSLRIKLNYNFPEWKEFQNIK